ncbi:MAG: hypothetical protein K0S67_1582 [Nitrososphaeraceae archaeon]|jgi:hypothetical protein|nr:hypothetical protein [Nitrososphaeraceae archaeon]MCD6037694.1 hypothetical protein [Nitrososphaeraceae archaeon]MDF2769734.1 hypothetical protein [Nitrososphaeraceae archaeon]
MTVGPEIRFKVTPDEYRYFEGLAKFYYDNGVIPKPSVHSLGKFAIIKAYNEWQIVQTTALQRRERRHKVIRSLIGDENNKSESASP